MRKSGFWYGCVTGLCALAGVGSMQAMAATAVGATTTYVLYDGSVAPAGPYNPPASQGWLAGGLLGVAQTASATGTQLAPLSGNAGYGGFSNHQSVISLFPLQVSTGELVNAAFPELDNQLGYSLDLRFALANEDHSGNANRAGFSMTLIGSDGLGIELGFQNDRIFAQGGAGNLFVATEQTTSADAVGLMQNATLWNLRVQDHQFDLNVGGLTFLRGQLRDYSSHTGLGESAYRTPNFVFFGDNTSSASATVDVSYAAINTYAAATVPEPQQALMWVGGLALLAWGTKYKKIRR